MATVDGLTKERMLAIEAESVTAARIDVVTNHLIFTTHGGSDIDVGSVQGPVGPVGPIAPAGALLDFAGAAAPAGWLLCDGSAVDRVAYGALFAAIGTAWGIGDGVSTFNIPDFRGRTSIGSGNGGVGMTNRVLGTKGGEESHVLTLAEVANHNHPDAGHNHIQNAHGHTMQGDQTEGPNYIMFHVPASSLTTGAGGAWPITGSQLNPTAATNQVGSAANAAAGGGGAHNNMPPYGVVLKIIKT